MIIVTGVGRSGTSTVARILHEETHVCMGHKFPPPDEWNPKGYYECCGSFQTLDQKHNYADCATHQFLDNVDMEWSLARFHDIYHCEKQYYGMKHPKLCEMNMNALQPSLIIVCTRRRQDVIKSHITRVLQYRNVHSIDFTERKTDEDVLDIISGWL
jgi:hypothetical protein